MRIRLVLDTCVIVAAIRSERGASHELLERAMRTGKGVRMVLSVPLINEYQDVIHRPENLVAGWTTEQLDALVDGCLVVADWVEPHFSYRPMLSDPGDELVLETAINGSADIVTFNQKHFRPASRFGISVFSPAEVLRALRKNEV